MENSGRIIVVTGGSKGIGKAIALRFARENATIIIIHYDPDNSAADDTLSELQGLGIESEAYRLDVSLKRDVDALFKDIISRFGRIDVLVNNAGITRDGLLMRMPEADWDAVLNINLKSVFHCTQAVIRLMIKQRKGAVVSISSVTGQTGNEGQANYAAAKAGIIGFTKSVAKEVASRGITVNAVAPGFIDTDMTAVLPDKVKEAILKKVPNGRLGRPEDVAAAVYWLCSEDANYVTGQTIHVNGGMYM